MRRLIVLLLSLVFVVPVHAAPPSVEAQKYEVKVLVDPSDEDRLVDAVGAKDTVHRDIWFIDTPSLELLAHGVIMRTRAVDDHLELTTKLRGPKLQFVQFSSFAVSDDFEAGVDVVK